jgi:HEAT repeat protein
LFAAIGLLRSVENPPVELANSMMEVFTNSVAQSLTETQFSIAQEIARILGDGASDIFTILFQSANQDLKIQGAKLLLSIHSSRADKILLAALADEKESLLAIEVLASIGYEAVELLIRALRESGSLGTNAEKTLVKIGTAAVPRLITSLNDSNWEMRIRAANALGEIGDERAIFPLENYGYDARIEVASSVRSALKKIRDPHGIEPLIADLHSSSSVKRRDAVYALAEVDDTRAIKAIFSSFQDSVHSSRSSLDGILLGKFNYDEFSMIEIDALRKIGEPAVQFLLTVLHDNEGNVNMAAAIALGLFGDALAVQRAVDELVSVFSRYALDFARCFSAERAIYAIGDSAVPFLLAALRYADVSACFHIERALAGFGRPAVPLLLKACQDQNLSSRLLHVVNALKKIGKPAVDALITVLHGSDWWGCMLAAKALGDIGDPRGLPELERLAIDNENGTLAVDVREAIEKIRQRMSESQKGAA